MRTNSEDHYWIVTDPTAAQISREIRAHDRLHSLYRAIGMLWALLALTGEWNGYETIFWLAFLVWSVRGTQNAEQQRDDTTTRVLELVEPRGVMREVKLWGHVYATIGGGHAAFAYNPQTPEDAQASGTSTGKLRAEAAFFDPDSIVAAIKKLEHHVRLFVPEWPGLRGVTFAADREFLNRWLAQTPEEIASSGSALVSEFDGWLRRASEEVLAKLEQYSAENPDEVFTVSVDREDGLSIELPPPRIDISAK